MNIPGYKGPQFATFTIMPSCSREEHDSDEDWARATVFHKEFGKMRDLGPVQNAELVELWDTLRGFDLSMLLKELSEAPIPFIDFEPEGREPRRRRSKDTWPPS
jgi:hypothetical protein